MLAGFSSLPAGVGVRFGSLFPKTNATGGDGRFTHASFAREGLNPNRLSPNLFSNISKARRPFHPHAREWPGKWSFVCAHRTFNSRSMSSTCRSMSFIFEDCQCLIEVAAEGVG